MTKLLTSFFCVGLIVCENDEYGEYFIQAKSWRIGYKVFDSYIEKMKVMKCQTS